MDNNVARLPTLRVPKFLRIASALMLSPPAIVRVLWLSSSGASSPVGSSMTTELADAAASIVTG